MLQAARMRPKEYHWKRPATKVLLEPDVLVDRDKGIAATSESIKQGSVVDIRSTEEPTDGRDLMGREESRQAGRHARI